MNIDAELLEKQITAILESNLKQEHKAGIHNLLGELLDMVNAKNFRIDLKNNLFVEVKEDSDSGNVGFIVDVFNGEDNLVDTHVYWYRDYKK